MMTDNIEPSEKIQPSLHAAIKRDDTDFVRSLVEKDPRICDVKDKDGRYPIQVAVVEGKEDMVRLLINASPGSLYYETPSGETLLDLARNNNKFSCFETLDELQQLDLPLNRIFNQQAEPFRDIAPPGEDVKRSEIAHDNSDNLQDDSTLEASEGNSTRTYGIGTSSTAWSEQQIMPLSLLLTVMVFIAGGAYAALLNFHEVFPIFVDQVKTVNLSILELLTFPSSTTEGFLFLTAATITFTSSVLVIWFALCSISLKWAARGTSFAALSLFMIVATFLSFFAMLNKLVPNFITIGGGHTKVPGVLVVVFYSIYVTVLVVPTLAFIVQRIIRGAFCTSSRTILELCMMEV